MSPPSGERRRDEGRRGGAGALRPLRLNDGALLVLRSGSGWALQDERYRALGPPSSLSFSLSLPGLSRAATPSPCRHLADDQVIVSVGGHDRGIFQWRTCGVASGLPPLPVIYQLLKKANEDVSMRMECLAAEELGPGIT